MMKLPRQRCPETSSLSCNYQLVSEGHYTTLCWHLHAWHLCFAYSFHLLMVEGKFNWQYVDPTRHPSFDDMKMYWTYALLRISRCRGKNLLIYSRNDIFQTRDLKSLSAVTTVPDHQSKKTCRRWDSFRHWDSCSMHAGIENLTRKYIVQQHVPFSRLLQMGKTIVLAFPLGLPMSPCILCWSSYQVWLVTI